MQHSQACGWAVEICDCGTSSCILSDRCSGYFNAAGCVGDSTGRFAIRSFDAVDASRRSDTASGIQVLPGDAIDAVFHLVAPYRVDPGAQWAVNAVVGGNVACGFKIFARSAIDTRTLRAVHISVNPFPRHAQDAVEFAVVRCSGRGRVFTRATGNAIRLSVVAACSIVVLARNAVDTVRTVSLASQWLVLANSTVDTIGGFVGASYAYPSSRCAFSAVFGSSAADNRGELACYTIYAVSRVIRPTVANPLASNTADAVLSRNAASRDDVGANGAIDAVSCIIAASRGDKFASYTVDTIRGLIAALYIDVLACGTADAVRP
jgi:hypothetical protein